MFTEVFLQHGAGNGPFKTEQVEFKESPLRHHNLGLIYTATGYGKKIPSRYMVKYNERWYRVYSRCYSNVSTEYIVSNGNAIIVKAY